MARVRTDKFGPFTATGVNYMQLRGSPFSYTVEIQGTATATPGTTMEQGNTGIISYLSAGVSTTTTGNSTRVAPIFVLNITSYTSGDVYVHIASTEG